MNRILKNTIYIVVSASILGAFFLISIVGGSRYTERKEELTRDQCAAQERSFTSVDAALVAPDSACLLILTSAEEVAALDRVGTLTQLRILRIDLRGETKVEIPAAVGNLTELRLLYLMGIQMNDLPEWVGGLKKLQLLDLTDNELSGLPDSIVKLENLSTLKLSTNQFVEIPESMLELRNLQLLSLQNNLLTELPASIAALSGLRELNLQGNRIEKIPAELGQLDLLHTLSLHANSYKTIPGEALLAPSLRQLFIGGSNLEDISSVFSATNLQTLYIQDAPLVTELPDRFDEFTALQGLLINGLSISSLPESIGTLRNLSSADFAENALTVIPEALGDDQNVMLLILADNLLKAIPDSVLKIPALERLELFGNPISEREIERIRDVIGDPEVVRFDGKEYEDVPLVEPPDEIPEDLENL